MISCVPFVDGCRLLGATSYIFMYVDMPVQSVNGREDTGVML